jgi:hypothetical protein
MYTAMRTGAIEKALFVGGSNAESLSVSASALGLDSYKITKGGWKLTKENVDKIIPVSGKPWQDCRLTRRSFSSAWIIPVFWAWEKTAA